MHSPIYHNNAEGARIHLFIHLTNVDRALAVSHAQFLVLEIQQGKRTLTVVLPELTSS